MMGDYGFEWEPQYFCDDPTTNAILNVAASIAQLAAATNGLLYGLKFGKQEGLSIAEALSEQRDYGVDGVARELESLADAVNSAGSQVAEAIVKAGAK